MTTTMAYPQEASDGLSVSDGGRAPPPTCLGDIFVGGLHKNPEAPAVISVSQPATHLMELLSAPTKHRDERDYLSWSYAQMEEASHQLCPELLKSGVPPRSSLVTFVWNSIEWALLLWCAAKMQITFVPLDANALNRKEETKYVLDLLSKNCAPSMIAVADSVMANTFDSLGFKSTAPLTKIVTNSTENELSGDWKSLLSLCSEKPTANPSEDPRRPSPCDTATMLFTSGTTGRPKACPHSLANLSTASHAMSSHAASIAPHDF